MEVGGHNLYHHPQVLLSAWHLHTRFHPRIPSMARALTVLCSIPCPRNDHCCSAHSVFLLIISIHLQFPWLLARQDFPGSCHAMGFNYPLYPVHTLDLCYCMKSAFNRKSDQHTGVCMSGVGLKSGSSRPWSGNSRRYRLMDLAMDDYVHADLPWWIHSLRQLLCHKL